MIFSHCEGCEGDVGECSIVKLEAYLVKLADELETVYLAKHKAQELRDILSGAKELP